MLTYREEIAIKMIALLTACLFIAILVRGLNCISKSARENFVRPPTLSKVISFANTGLPQFTYYSFVNSIDWYMSSSWRHVKSLTHAQCQSGTQASRLNERQTCESLSDRIKIWVGNSINYNQIYKELKQSNTAAHLLNPS